MSPPRPPVIELVGPAGAGKSTVAAWLARDCRRFLVTRGVWCQPRWDLAASALALAPRLARLWWRTREPLWEESAQLIRLEALHRRLLNGAFGAAGAGAAGIVLDEGPVFALAWLIALGHPALRTTVPEHWWRAAIARWAGTLDVVVRLDAPATVLRARIDQRAKPHLFKGAGAAQVEAFSARFREAFDRVLESLPIERAPAVLRFDTAADPPAALAARLALALEHRNHAA